MAEARKFSTSVNYAVGDYVINSAGELLVFITAHPAGAWNPAHVRYADDRVQGKINRIISGAENAAEAADFADTVIFEPELIHGTRYKYTLTDAPDPRK